MFSSSVDDFDLFGEAGVSLGSDRVFVRRSAKGVDEFDDPPDGLEVVLDTFTVDWLPFFSGTVGGRYLRDLENDAGSILAVLQYFFNGEGYPDSSLLEPAAFLAQNADTNGLAVSDEESQPEGYAGPPALGFADLSNWGRHYAAGTLSWSDIGGSEISLSVFALANLSDLSGIITPTLRFPILDVLSMSVSGRLTFGNDGDEFTNPAALFDTGDETTGSTFAFTISAGLGGGSF